MKNNLHPSDPFNMFRNAKPIKIVTEQQDKENKLSRKAEFLLRRKICLWLKEVWYNLLFIVDYAADMPLPVYIADQIKQQSCNDKMVDLLILEPRGGYFGLYIEIKTIKGNVFLKDGSLSQEKHTQAQYDTVKRFCDMGYLSLFGVGENMIKSIVNHYMSLPLTVPNKVFTKHDRIIYPL